MNERRIVRLDGLRLTIEYTNVRAVLADDDRPIWAGKIVLTFDQRRDGLIKVVTANMAGRELHDLEGDCENDDPVYSVVERWTVYIVDAIEAELGKPRRFDAVAA